MKLFKKLRKGFTLIELVVVIAVIAVLAAVSVVSYVSITNNAKKSKDQQLVDQVNLSLQAAEITKAPVTMHEALEIVEEDGYKPAKFKAEYKEHEFAYNLTKNRFVLVKGNEVTYPKDMGPESGKNYQIWKFADAAGTFSDGFSHYLRQGASGTSVTADAGFDVGYNTGITSITYSTGAEQDVVIRTDSALTNLTINGEHSTVTHYGNANVIYVTKVDYHSYHENGSVAEINIKAGKVEIEKNAYVGKVGVDKDATSSTVQVMNSGTVFDTKVVVYTEESATTSASATDYSGSAPAASTIVDNVDVVDYSSSILKVNNADALINLAHAHAKKIVEGALEIEITENIDLTKKVWVPFGLEVSNPFSGTINGRNKTIKGLSFSSQVNPLVQQFETQSGETGYPFGLIAYACENLTIKDLTIESDIVSPDGVGVSGFVGLYNNIVAKTDTTEYTIRFENCTAKGRIEASTKVGGFVGSGFITLGSTFANTKLGLAKADQRRAKTSFQFVNCNSQVSLKATRASGAKAGGFSSGLPIYGGATTSENIGGSSISIVGSSFSGSMTLSGSDYYGAFCGYLSGNASGTIDHSGFTNLTTYKDVANEANTAW